MNNLFFEMALFRYLYSYYEIEKIEELLQIEKIQPLLNKEVYCSTISKYFRLMNKVDYSKLSFFERRYISKYFTKENDVEQNWNQKKAISIYLKIIKNISLRPKGYTTYCYDGYIIEGTTPNFGSSNFAPNNYITFGIYYTQFDKNTEIDEFRNHNIVAELSNTLQEKGIAVISFSEVDMYRTASIRL